jgi:hypothetical protein
MPFDINDKEKIKVEIDAIGIGGSSRKITDFLNEEKGIL